MKCAQKRTNVSHGNPIIAEIEHAKTFKKHRDSLRNIQPAIDNRPPKPQPHLQLYGRNFYARKKATTEAAFNDLKMIQSIARTMTRPYMLPSTKGPVSLNANYRKRELFRITMDNHRLLERLETLQPVISTKKMDEQHKNNQLYMVNASYSARKVGNYDAIISRNAKKRNPSPRGVAQSQSTPTLPAIQNKAANSPILASPQSNPAEPAGSKKEKPGGAEATTPGGKDEEDYEDDDFEDEN